MTPDRDETLLRNALQTGLRPTEIDLWPAVAEALPAGERRQKRRTRALRLALCLGAPLLLAAGALLGQVKFTNLRTNPRPSFAPENNTGYAIQYDQTAYQLPDELMDSLLAHYNGQHDADGMPPMRTFLSGRNLPPEGPGGRGYDSWADLTKATGLPLVQSDLLDSGTPDDSGFSLIPYSYTIPLPDDWQTFSVEERNAYYKEYNESQWRLAGAWPAGFSVEWDEDTPMYLYPRRVDKLSNGCTIETQAYVLLAAEERPAGTSSTGSRVYYDKKAGFVWEVEEYTTPSGIVALLPRCTSNGKTSPYLNAYAFFEQNGIFYRLEIIPYDGWGQIEDGGEAARAVLKEVLDSIEPAA